MLSHVWRPGPAASHDSLHRRRAENNQGLVRVHRKGHRLKCREFFSSLRHCLSQFHNIAIHLLSLVLHPSSLSFFSRSFSDVPFSFFLLVEQVSDPPAAFEQCGVVDCPVKLSYLPGPCSHTCGGGVSVPVRHCSRMKANGFVYPLPAKDCEHLKTEPPNFPLCNPKPCTPFYVVYPWEQCSVTCGDGVQNRKIVCRQRREGAIKTVTDEICDVALGPRLGERECKTEKVCPGNYIWTEGPWSLVSEWMPETKFCMTSCGMSD